MMWTSAEGFAGVPEAVWNFHIGGYQVCQKWLKGRRLSKDDIAHYGRIVVALRGGRNDPVDEGDRPDD